MACNRYTNVFELFAQIPDRQLLRFALGLQCAQTAIAGWQPVQSSQRYDRARYSFAVERASVKNEDIAGRLNHQLFGHRPTRQRRRKIHAKRKERKRLIGPTT